MPMKMLRSPQVARRVFPAVLSEVRVSYAALGLAVIKKLQEDVADWDNPPKFTYKVSVNKKKWTLEIKYDRRTKAGKIYDWVSKGTGSRGLDPGGKTYYIYPKRAKALAFPLPMTIKTIPSPPKFAPSLFAATQNVVVKKVTAPGIYPRKLGEKTYDHLKGHRSGSFRNVTEAAIKRAFRRMGIYVG